MRIAEVLQNLYMHSHPSSFLQLICRLATPTPQHLIVLRSQSTAWGNKLSANSIFEQETGLRRMSRLLVWASPVSFILLPGVFGLFIPEGLPRTTPEKHKIPSLYP